MKFMFMDCKNIHELDFTYWNTENVENFSGFLSCCSNLTSVKIGNNFKTNNAKNVSFMFDGCMNIKELDLSNWNTENIINYAALFQNCTSIIKLNLNFWKIQKQKICAVYFKTVLI